MSSCPSPSPPRALAPKRHAHAHHPTTTTTTTTTIDALAPELLDLIVERMAAADKRQFRRTCTRHRDAVDRAVRAAEVPDCRLSVAQRVGGLLRLVLPFRRWPGLRTLGLQRLGRFRLEWLAGLGGLRHLNLAACGGLDLDDCAGLARSAFWERLKTLDVSFNGIGLAGLWELVQAPAPRLKRFALRESPGDLSLAPDGLKSALPALVQNWPGVVHVSLRGQWMLGGSGVCAFAAGFPGLLALDVSGCVEPERLGITLGCLADLLPRLESLRIENPVPVGSRSRIGDGLDMAFPRLRVLSMRGHRLGMTGINALRRVRAPALEYLDLGGAARRSDNITSCVHALKSLSTPRLTGLSLDGWLVRHCVRDGHLDHDFTYQLSKAFPGLTRLGFGSTDFSHLAYVNSDFVDAIAARFPGLEHLELSGTDEDSGLNGGVVLRALAALPRLRVLRVLVNVPPEMRLDNNDESRLPWPELFEDTAHLDEYSPHTSSSVRANRPDVCLADRPPGWPHVYRRAPRQLHEFDAFDSAHASGVWPSRLEL